MLGRETSVVHSRSTAPMAMMHTLTTSFEHATRRTGALDSKGSTSISRKRRRCFLLTMSVTGLMLLLQVNEQSRVSVGDALAAAALAAAALAARRPRRRPPSPPPPTPKVRGGKKAQWLPRHTMRNKDRGWGKESRV